MLCKSNYIANKLREKKKKQKKQYFPLLIFKRIDIDIYFIHQK